MMTSQIELALPKDEELERLSAYLTGSMSPAERARFREELESDAEFFYRMAPMMDLWYSRKARPKSRITSTGVTLSLVAPSPRFARVAQIAVAASLVWGAVLYNPVSTAVIERVALGPEPAQVKFEHHPRQSKSVTPTPFPVRVATVTKHPTKTVQPEKVVAVADPVPSFPIVAGPVIDSLPSIGAVTGTRVDVAVYPSPHVTQWRPRGEGDGFSVGGFAKAVGDKLVDWWNDIRHPRTHKPKPNQGPTEH